MWRVAYLSDNSHVFSGCVPAAGDNSAAQKRLSKILSSSIARYAGSADPIVNRGGINEKHAHSEMPPAFSMELFGLPLGTRLLEVSSQIGMDDATTDRQRAVLSERVCERCKSINGEKARAEMGIHLLVRLGAVQVCIHLTGCRMSVRTQVEHCPCLGSFPSL